MLRRTVTAVLAASLVPVVALAADAAKPPKADKLKPVLLKLYAKTAFDDTIARSQLTEELKTVLQKDRKGGDLKFTAWWSETIREGLYQSTPADSKLGDRAFVAYPPKTKEVLKDTFETFPNGLDKPAAKAAFAYRGPNGYTPKRGFPILISIVDAKTDPSEYLKTAWAPVEDMAKDWVLVCVAESDAFNLAKEPAGAARLLGRMLRQFHVDPNRVYVEGVGAACGTAQTAATLALADRIAGQILRNPQESRASENCTLFPTVVMKGPEGAEKAAAVFAKYKEIGGEARAIELAVPEVAQLSGLSTPLADWLRQAKPREPARSFSWVTTYQADGSCTNPGASGFFVQAPQKAGEPTKAKVAFDRATNVVDIQCTNLGEYHLLLNDDLVDLDKEVTVFVNGQQVEKKTFDRDVDQMLRQADEFFEYGFLYPALYTAFVPTTIAAPADAKKDGPDAKEPEKK